MAQAVGGSDELHITNSISQVVAFCWWCMILRKSKVKIKEETYVWRATYCVKSVSVYCGILRCNSNFRVGRPCQAEVVIITMKFVQIEPSSQKRSKDDPSGDLQTHPLQPPPAAELLASVSPSFLAVQLLMKLGWQL